MSSSATLRFAAPLPMSSMWDQHGWHGNFNGTAWLDGQTIEPCATSLRYGSYCSYYPTMGFPGLPLHFSMLTPPPFCAIKLQDIPAHTTPPAGTVKGGSSSVVFWLRVLCFVCAFVLALGRSPKAFLHTLSLGALDSTLAVDPHLSLSGVQSCLIVLKR